MPNDSGLSSLFSDVSDTPKEQPVSPFGDIKMPQVFDTVKNVLAEVPLEKKGPSEKDTVQVPEIVGDGTIKDATVEIASPRPNSPSLTDAEKLRFFLKEDPVYQDMIRTVDINTIRSRLAMRYLFLMFAIFLVLAWIVNNRVIMFGFSEFQWLARIRDVLFAVMAGLLSMTLWYGAPTWFGRTLLILIVRVVSVCFFVGVVSALYFPLW